MDPRAVFVITGAPLLMPTANRPLVNQPMDEVSILERPELREVPCQLSRGFLSSTHFYDTCDYSGVGWARSVKATGIVHEIVNGVHEIK